MSTLDDLLSQRRHAPLSEADERRVQIGVKSSRDHQLALLAGEVFDRAGAPQLGDAELVRKIVRQVEGEWSGTFLRQSPGARSRPRPKWSRWAAVPTLIAGVAAASWGGERLLHALRAAPSTSNAVSPPAVVVSPAVVSPTTSAEGALESADDAAPGNVKQQYEARLALESQPSAASASSESEPAARSPAAGSVPGSSVAGSSVAGGSVARGARARGADARSMAAAPVLLRPAAPRAEVGAGQAGVSSAVPPLPQVAAGETARSVFLRANRLRRDDWVAAAALYEQLIRRFATSDEAGVAEMALGKHALDEGHPDQALSWFRAYQQRPNGELASEALWGEARALESLGEAAAARAVWRRLIADYPASAYAAVARQQLGS